jgi:hypothetical protein
MRHVGFPAARGQWISTLLSTATTRILLNGVQGEHICHASGLRKAIPCRRCLCLLMTDVLNSLFHTTDSWSLLQQLLPRQLPYHVSMYADDMVLFLSPSHRISSSPTPLLSCSNPHRGLDATSIVPSCTHTVWRHPGTASPGAVPLPDQGISDSIPLYPLIEEQAAQGHTSAARIQNG